jgi:formylglycine-generating enzyme required for sulfatase activity
MVKMQKTLIMNIASGAMVAVFLGHLPSQLSLTGGLCAEETTPPERKRNLATEEYASRQEYLAAAAGFEFERLARPLWSAPQEAERFSQETLRIDLAPDVDIRFRRIAADHFIDAFPADVKQTILATPSRANDLQRFEKGMDTRRRGRVVVPYDYFMSETLVTNAMFKAFVKATGYRTSVSRYRTGWIVTRDAQWLQGIANEFDQERHPLTQPDHPVVQVSWFDAMQFARWLSERAGIVARLPTFDEWAVAARPKSMRDGACVFPWGNSLDRIEQRLNFGSGELDYTWMHDKLRDGHAFSSPVRAYPANEQGLHDMVGNVWCWSFTPAADFHRRADGDRQAALPVWEHLEVARNGAMAMHGGCYLARLTHVTLFAPMSHPALDGAEDIGFRLVVVRAATAGVPLKKQPLNSTSNR